jgi:SAM-dependent MidA family methyltransferase
MLLSGIITDKIHRDGPISFHDFMEMCLYYPGLGYYTSESDKIGEKGDYYTSASLTPAFGATIGRQLEEMWHLLGEEDFTIVEYGAGVGRLCGDILNYLEGNTKLFSRLNYCIIEKSPAMREKARAHLPEKVSWHDSITDIHAINGCILSNELLDNFSVHRVVMGAELMEVFVDHNAGFTEVLQPASPELKNYFAELKVALPKGFCTEVNLEATKWVKEIASSLQKGYVLTIDYGYPSHELYCGNRHRGTLMCYNKHKINDHPYSHIGEQDITTHVNFSALHHWGIKNGLNSCGFTDQAHFLLSLGFEDHFKKLEHNDNEQDSNKAAFVLHTLLVDMGNKFKVLIQEKGSAEQKLSGLRYRRNYSGTALS